MPERGRLGRIIAWLTDVRDAGIAGAEALIRWLRLAARLKPCPCYKTAGGFRKADSSARRGDSRG